MKRQNSNSQIFNTLRKREKNITSRTIHQIDESYRVISNGRYTLGKDIIQGGASYQKVCMPVSDDIVYPEKPTYIEPAVLGGTSHKRETMDNCIFCIKRAEKVLKETRADKDMPEEKKQKRINHCLEIIRVNTGIIKETIEWFKFLGSRENFDAYKAYVK